MGVEMSNVTVAGKQRSIFLWSEKINNLLGSIWTGIEHEEDKFYTAVVHVVSAV